MKKAIFFILITIIAQLAVAQPELDKKTADAQWRKDYTEVGNFQEGVACVTNADYKLGVVNAEGKIVIPMKYYNDAYNFKVKNGLIALANLEEKYGLLNSKGDTILPFKYKKLAFDNLGNYMIFSELKDSIGLIDTKGRVVLEEKYVSILQVGNNDLYIIYSSYDKCGLSSSNKEILPIEYRYLMTYGTKQYIVGQKGEKWGILNLKGEIIVPFDYQRITITEDNQTFIGKKQNKEAHLDLKQNAIFPYQYNSLSLSDKKDCYIVAENGKYGFVNSKGKIMIPLEYDYIEKAENGLGYTVTIGNYDEGNAKSHLLFPNGKKFENTYSYSQPFLTSDNKKCAIASQNDKKFGILDTEGNEYLPFEYDKIEYFEGDNFILAKNGKYSYANAKNLKKVKFDYDFLQIVNPYSGVFKNCFYAKQQGKMGIVDNNFKVRIALEYDSLARFRGNDSLQLARKNDKWGLVNYKNEIVVPFEYENITTYNYNYFFVYQNGKKGMINKSNKLILPYGLDKEDGVTFIGNLIYAKQNGYYGAVNLKGELVLPFDYGLYFSTYSSNHESIQICRIKSSNKIAKLDVGNAKIVSELYEEQVSLTTKLIALKKEGKFAFADAQTWQPISEFEYDSIGRGLYYEGTKYQKVSYIVKKNGLIGVLDSNFKLQIPYEYEAIFPNSYRYEKNYLLRKKEKTYIFDRNCRLIAEFNKGEPFEIENDSIVKCSRKVGSRLNQYNKQPEDIYHYGIVGVGNKTIVPINFDYINPQKNGFIVTKNGKYGYYNDKGKMIFDTIYNGIGQKYNILSLATKAENGNYNYTLANNEGKMLLPFVMRQIELSDSMIVLSRKSSRKDSYGYEITENAAYNYKLEQILPFEYENISDKRDGTLEIKKNGLTGWSNYKGQMIISMNYRSLYKAYRHKGWIIAMQGGEYGVIDTKERVIIPLIYKQLGETNDQNRWIAQKGDYFGIIDTLNHIITPFEYNKIDQTYKDEKNYSIRREGKEGTLYLDGSEYFPADAIMMKYGVFDEVKPNFIADSIMCVRFGKRWGFATKQGKITAPLKYTKVENRIVNNAMLVSNGEQWGVVYMGKEVIPCQYDKITTVSEFGRYIVVKSKEKSGIVSFDNQLIVPYQYDYIKPSLANTAIVKKGFKYGLIDTQNKALMPIEYDDIFAEKQCLVFIKNDKIGIATASGKILAEAQYDEIMPFDNGVAAVLKNNKWYYINAKGEKISLGFDKLKPQSEELDKIFIGTKQQFAYKNNGKVVFKNEVAIKIDGERLADYELSRASEGYAVIKISDKFGLIDAKENIIIEPLYDYLYSPKNGLLRATKNKKEGVINLKQEIIVPLEYDNVYMYLDKFIVTKDNKQGVLDNKGKLVIPIQYKDIEFINLKPQRYIFKNELGKKGVLDEKGKIILEAKYDRIKFFGNEYIVIEDNYPYICLGINGKPVSKIPYSDFIALGNDYVLMTDTLKQLILEKPDGSKVILGKGSDYYSRSNETLSDGLIAINKKYNVFSYYDSDGKEVLSNLKYEEVKGFHHGFAAVKQEGKWGFINREGKAICDFDFDEVANFSNDGLAAVRIQKKIAFINTKGEIAIPFIFDDWGGINDLTFDNGIARVLTDRSTYKIGYINTQGKILFRGKKD